VSLKRKRNVEQVESEKKLRVQTENEEGRYDGTCDSLHSYYSNFCSYCEGQLEIGGVKYKCAVGGDKAYKCLQLPLGWQLYITKSGESHDVDEEQRAHDRGISFVGKGKKKKEEGKGKKKKRESRKKLPKNTELGTPLNTDMDKMQLFCPEIAIFVL
tara:strand:- start:787 stop:1257 length:471 start_codon:yes stop_codon:yes gene_type:complete